MSLPKVIVLLGSYNGEKYLRVQIDSILAQEGVDVFILASDDRSNDKTIEIFKEYKQKYPNFDYRINEKNKGFGYNFLDAYFSIKNEKFDYCAFADQDDYWLPNKLFTAIKQIEKDDCKNGCFYCSNLKLVDAELKDIGYMEDKSVLNIQKYVYLTTNIATGCTVVVNRRFYDHSIKYYPVGIYRHDYWLFMIAVFTASYIYDFDAYILYRQHGNNQIGSNKSTFTKAKFKAFRHPKYYTSTLVKELFKGFSDDIYKEDLPYVKIAGEYQQSFKKKNKLLFSRKIKKRRHKFLFKIIVLFNRY